MLGAHCQTLAHKQRMPTSQGGADKYAFSAPYDGHFVNDKQSHCRPVVRHSQSENTAPLSRQEFTCDVSVSNCLCDRVNQAENALTKAIQSLTSVIAKFESLVNSMSCSNDVKSKQIGTDSSHVFVSSSRNEDHIEKRSSKNTPQNIDVCFESNGRVDPVDPAVIVCDDEVHLIDQNSPLRNSVCCNQGKEIDSSVALHNVVVEVNPQVFEVANLEKSDDVFEDAQVDVCDVLNHDDVKITESVVNDFVVASSILTQNVSCEVPPTAAYQEAIGEANNSNIDPYSGRAVSSKQTQSLDGINSPFHTKDSSISVSTHTFEFPSVVRYRSCRYCSKCSRLAKVCK